MLLLATSVTFKFCYLLIYIFIMNYLQSRRKMPAAKKENLDDLKQELDIDFHKISPEELYQRFQTHPENVSRKAFAIFHSKS